MRLPAPLLALLVASTLASAARKQPNIVLILVDDQDARQDSIATMGRVQELLVKEGTQFTHSYAPISVCCPSRTSLLRAQAAHNTNITSVVAPWGGWEVFNEKGYNGHYLPSFLQEAGYDTYYTGKLMNDHKVSNIGSMPALGWTDSDFLVDPQTYNYWNASFVNNAGPVVYHEGEYSTDLVAAKGLAALDLAAKNPDRPFFVGIAPIAPHSHISGVPNSLGGILFDVPQSAPRHAHLFKDTTLNYSRESHNPPLPSGVSWVRDLERLNSTHVEHIEEFYRQRLRALQAVDELVEGVVKKLEEMGVLEDTFIIYTSDNGFEANVVRGPSVPKGLVDSASVYSLADLGATILHLAGAETDYENDGSIIPITRELRESVKEEGVKQFHLAEYWVEGIEEGRYAGPRRINQTYRAIRVVEGTEINFSYAVWCTGEHEIYDLNADPDQMDNLAETSRLGHLRPPSLARLQTRLDALLLVLKTCVGDVCRAPWKSIFPSGEVSSLADALHNDLDSFFGALPKVQYSYCDIGYHRRLEAPFWHAGLAFGTDSGLTFQ
ncbi:hypothetical protein RQP46_005812 [Phenoliferia psychrophenolica]